MKLSALSSKADRGLKDLFFFLTEYWRLDLEEIPHREMCGVVQESEEDDSHPYAMLVVPRGSYKTSIARGTAVWKQLRQTYLYENFYYRLMIASAVLGHGETSLRNIEGQLRTNNLLKDYGELWIEPNGKGAPSSRHPDGIMLAPRIRAGEIASVAEPSFWIGSLLRVSTGYHGDGAVVDDLNNKDNVMTDDRREKTKTYWRLVFPLVGKLDRLGRPSRILLNATPWHDDDVRGMILREEREKAAARPDFKSKWIVLHRGARWNDENGEEHFFWPDKLGPEVLDELRDDMSSREFSANYLCDPVGEDGFVTEDEIVIKPLDEFPELKYERLLVDPSQHMKAKALGCYTAMVVAGYDRFNNLYIRDAMGSRDWDSADLIDQLFQVEARFPNIPMMIEDKHMAHFDHAIHLEETIRAEKTGKRVHLRIQYVPADGESKYEKWEKLQPRFRSRRVVFAREIDRRIMAEIKEELLRGKAARFKDFLDAIAMAEYGVRPKSVQMAPGVQKISSTGAAQLTMRQIVPGLDGYFK